MKDYLMKVTTNSPRRSQYNGLLISPTTGTAVPASAVTSSSTASTKVPGKSSSSHHLTPTYVRSTGASFSSLKRVKNVPLYSSSHVKSSPSSTMDNRSIYATYGRLGPSTPTTSLNAGHYRSPSRILLESGQLTLPGHTSSNSHHGQHGHHHQHHHHSGHHHHGHGKDHVYENLYSSPNNNTTTNNSTVDVPDSSVLSSPNNKNEKYMSNLRSSVQLKRSHPCANCSKPESPSITTTTSSSLDRKLYKGKSKDRKDKCPNCSGGGLNNKTITSNGSGKSSQLKSSSQLNQQVIWIKDESGDANGHNNNNKNGETKSVTRNASTASGKNVSSRKKRKNWWQRDWFLEVDPQRRFQFIQSTLIICNVFALLCGVIGLIVAGFVDPRPSLTSFGGQLTCVSVYIILTSLTGLYGARRESVSLLVLYGCMIVASLFFRSIFYFVVTFVTSSATSIALSMIAAFLEVILILFAFALASEVRLKKLDRKRKQDDLSKGQSVNSKNKQSRSSNDSANGSTGNGKNKNNSTDRDIESASPVASAETDSTTSNVESTGLFANGDLNSSGRFISSGSPLFASLSRSPGSLLVATSKSSSPITTRATVTSNSTLRPLSTALDHSPPHQHHHPHHSHHQRSTPSPSASPGLKSARSLGNNKSNSIIASLAFTSPGAVTSRTITSTLATVTTTASPSTTTATAASIASPATPGRGMALAQISPSSATRYNSINRAGDSLFVKSLSSTTPALASASASASTTTMMTSVSSSRAASGAVNSLMTSYSMSINRSINNSSTLKGGGGVRPAAYF